MECNLEGPGEAAEVSPWEPHLVQKTKYKVLRLDSVNPLYQGMKE